MGMVSVYPICTESQKVSSYSVYVYVDDNCVGKTDFFKPLTVQIDKPSKVSACLNGDFSKEITVPSDGDYYVVVNYDYYSDVFTKIELCDSDGNPLNRSRNSAKTDVKTNYGSNNKGFVYSPKEESETMYRRIKEAVGTLHLLYIAYVILVVLGSFIAFCALIAEVPEIAWSVLLGAGVLLIASYVQYIVAGYFYFAAVDKGYKGLAYFALPWLLTFIGYLLVIALPDRGKKS